MYVCDAVHDACSVRFERMPGSVQVHVYMNIVYMNMSLQ